MSDDADHVLLVLPRGEREEILISRSRYEGRVFTKLHKWFRGQDGQKHPTRAVVTIRDHELPQVIEALQKIAAKIGTRPAATERRGPSRQQQFRNTLDAAPPAPASDADLAADEGLF